ncbi:MAG: 1-deoxy-D-xylulose-5-phosphate synthase N-terminal domain-containing protein [archaeon]
MDLNQEEISSLNQKAKQLRKEIIDLAVEKQDFHPGGELSSIELLVALYNLILKPQDKFLLGKGHNCYSMYCLLRQKGYNPIISKHPDIDEKNNISCTSGSLGHALPIAAGMAFARKLEKKPGHIYVLLGDGECQEGTLWETSLLLKHYKLDNLTTIIDYNKIQGSDHLEKILPLPENLKATFENLGWHTLEIEGHSFSQIIPALQQETSGKPKMIIAHTIKGKGISFMENNPLWHGGVPKGEQLKQAYEELK